MKQKIYKYRTYQSNPKISWIKAVQYDGTREMADFLGCEISWPDDIDAYICVIKDEMGYHNVVTKNDWVVRWPDGGIHVMSNEVFEHTYTNPLEIK